MTNHPLDQAVSAKVRGLLAEKNRTANDLASVLGKTPQTVGKRLRGATPFTVIELVTIAGWLGVDVHRFIPPTPPTAVVA